MNTEGRAKLEAREVEALPDPWYEKLIEDMQDWRRRAETGLVLIKGKELPWYQNR
ncbi:MAG: hypothetical protein HYV04_14430, partial [Deltaproteobacteria bacterium]|nr:hypothetical protein [Deltaproteobacteria bacterium]